MTYRIPDPSLPFAHTTGPHDARILAVGESWGQEEDAQGIPLVGGSGREFNRMLSDAGFSRSEVLCTNVVDDRPPSNEMFYFFYPNKEAKEAGMVPLRGLYPRENVLAGLAKLKALILAVQPEVVLALGSYALWALSDVTKVDWAKWPNGHSTGILEPIGIGQYRGSMLRALPEYGRSRLLPLYHPAGILREWSFRALTVFDLAVRIPLAFADDWDRPEPAVVFQPSYEGVLRYLDDLLCKLARFGPFRLCADIETARHCITCIGLADRDDFAFTIPFIALDAAGAWTPRWTIPQQAAILSRLRILLRDCEVEGQNFTYDLHYTVRDWGVLPNVTYDTMAAEHVMLPGLPKSLAHLSSLYCHHHWFWKDDNKEWDAKGALGDHLRYNAEDLLRQWEIGRNQRAVMKVRHPLQPASLVLDKTERFERAMARYHLAIRMMLRGTRINQREREHQLLVNMRAAHELQQRLLRIVPAAYIPLDIAKTPKARQTHWFNSAQQTKWVFYSLFRFKAIRDRKRGTTSTGKEALNELSQLYPKFVVFFDMIRDIRSLGIYDRNFLRAPVDHDIRLRTYFNSSGTETYRFSSSRNPLGIGTNLQNIPEGTKDA